MRHALRLRVLGALLCSGSTALAGPGAAELALDRSAVREIVALALPQRLEVEIPAVGSIEVHLGAPRSLELVEGAVAAALPVELPQFRWSDTIDVRYVAEIEPIRGHVQLVPASAVARSTGPGWLDLARWLEPIALPRRFDWTVDLDGPAPAQVTAFVQRVSIDADRVRIELGLSLGARRGG